MTFSEAVTTAGSEASTNIAEMIKELSHPMGLEIPIIDVGGASMIAVDVAEGSYLPGDSRE